MYVPWVYSFTYGKSDGVCVFSEYFEAVFNMDVHEK